MDASVEMKIQAIDKMIELRKQLIVMQDNMGVWNGLDKDCVILVYNASEFFDIAKHVGANVESDEICEQGLRIMFSYKNTTFVAYINPSDYQHYESEIDRGDSDA